jgi:dipeptidyl aminopeptidase/acylaminoacyl peptidase
MRMIAHKCAGDRPSIFVQVTTPDAGENGVPAERVIRIDAAGDNGQEVFRTSPGQGISGIAGAPDGRRLSVVTRLDRYRRALVVTTAEGGAPRQIHEFRQPTGGGVDHVWSPDGRSILYVQMSESWKEDQTFFLRSVRADGTSTDPLTVFRWTGQFFWVNFRPDGRMLAFSGRPNVSTSSEVWVIENLREELNLLASSRPRRP